MSDFADGKGNSLSFDRVAVDYEATRYMPLSVAHSVARHVTDGLEPQEWVLDAGVGTGRIGRSLAQALPERTVGVDISRSMMAQMHDPNRAQIFLPFLALADLSALPFADQTFAAALAVHVFHLIPDWETALGELWRVLRPGGRLLLGKEEHDRSPVQDYYLREANRRGLLPPNPGATTMQALQALRQRGGTVHEERSPSLTWVQHVSTAATLARLEARAYSVLWFISEKDHAELLEKTQQWAYANRGLAEAAQTFETRLVLYEVRKPKK